MELQNLAEDGMFSPELIAKELRTHKYEIAQTLGLKKEAVSRASRIKSPKVQMLLRQMIEILARVETRTGSPLLAYAWFRGVPLVGFGGKTADRLFREGKADYVRAHLDAVDDGGYA